MPKSTADNSVTIYSETLKVRTNDTFSEVDLGDFASGTIREWFFVDLCYEV